MCQKIPYEDKEEAKEAIKFITSQRRHYTKKLGRHKKSGRSLREYPCCYCGKWHLTTSKQK